MHLEKRCSQPRVADEGDSQPKPQTKTDLHLPAPLHSCRQLTTSRAFQLALSHLCFPLEAGHCLRAGCCRAHKNLLQDTLHRALRRSPCGWCSPSRCDHLRTRWSILDAGFGMVGSWDDGEQGCPLKRAVHKSKKAHRAWLSIRAWSRLHTCTRVPARPRTCWAQRAKHVLPETFLSSPYPSVRVQPWVSGSSSCCRAKASGKRLFYKLF